MLTEMGEYLVGAYLKLRLECDFVDYNVRPPGGKLEGLEELDVVGLNFKTGTAHLCEVTTHIRGLGYVDYATTITRIKSKHARQRKYAAKFLREFRTFHYAFWSPVVPRGYLTDQLEQVSGLELVINGEYKKRISELQELARRIKHDVRNPAFRVLQIVAHMRD